LPVAIVGGRVEVGDARVERTCDGLALFGRIPADHEPADGATAKPERRHLQAGTTQGALFHAPYRTALGRSLRPPTRLIRGWQTSPRCYSRSSSIRTPCSASIDC